MLSSLKLHIDQILKIYNEFSWKNCAILSILYYWPHMTPLWSLLGTPISRCAKILLHQKLSFSPNMNLRIWEAKKVTCKKSFYLCMYFAHNQLYWIHFLSDFQNRDYFWNQQACPILVRSLVFFSTIQGVNHTWFSIFGENLGLSQKFT